ncbi:MAG: hypothetical protein H7196_00200 [candidate division SR1 bacterium]|nr:hypothetical protein [candidate division SR1 bacterium]
MTNAISVKIAISKIEPYFSLLERILSWDISHVKKHFLRDNPNINSELAASQYFYFIYLVCVTGDTLYVPSREIDAITHSHILYTHDYRNFCKFCAGADKYILHRPHLASLSKEKTEFEKSKIRSLCLSHFGDANLIKVTELCCPSAMIKIG